MVEVLEDINIEGRETVVGKERQKRTWDRKVKNTKRAQKERIERKDARVVFFILILLPSPPSRTFFLFLFLFLLEMRAWDVFSFPNLALCLLFLTLASSIIGRGLPSMSPQGKGKWRGD